MFFKKVIVFLSLVLIGFIGFAGENALVFTYEEGEDPDRIVELDSNYVVDESLNLKTVLMFDKNEDFYNFSYHGFKLGFDYIFLNFEESKLSGEISVEYENLKESGSDSSLESGFILSKEFSEISIEYNCTYFNTVNSGGHYKENSIIFSKNIENVGDVGYQFSKNYTDGSRQAGPVFTKEFIDFTLSLEYMRGITTGVDNVLTVVVEKDL